LFSVADRDSWIEAINRCVSNFPTVLVGCESDIRDDAEALGYLKKKNNNQRRGQTNCAQDKRHKLLRMG